MREILVSPGWMTHESGEKWYWDGHGWRGNLADFQEAPSVSTLRAEALAASRSGPVVPSGPGVEFIEIVGEERHLPAIQRLFDADHASGEITAFATLNAVPGHRNDPYAVEVLIDGNTVGHIPSDVTPRLQPTVVTTGPIDHVVSRVWLGTRFGAPWARVTLFYVPA